MAQENKNIGLDREQKINRNIVRSYLSKGAIILLHCGVADDYKFEEEVKNVDDLAKACYYPVDCGGLLVAYGKSNLLGCVYADIYDSRGNLIQNQLVGRHLVGIATQTSRVEYDKNRNVMARAFGNFISKTFQPELVKLITTSNRSWDKYLNSKITNEVIDGKPHTSMEVKFKKTVEVEHVECVANYLGLVVQINNAIDTPINYYFKKGRSEYPIVLKKR